MHEAIRSVKTHLVAEAAPWVRLDKMSAELAVARLAKIFTTAGAESLLTELPSISDLGSQLAHWEHDPVRGRMYASEWMSKHTTLTDAAERMWDLLQVA